MHNKLPIIFINGVLGEQVSVLDRGFSYGDGVFETCRMIDGEIPLWNRHRDRLIESCKRLMISVSVELVNDYLHQITAHATPKDIANAVVKIIVTRGQGGRGYRVPAEINPTICISIFPAAQVQTSYSDKGIAVKICRQRLGCNRSLAGLKHLNRLEHILARAEWSDDNIAEGLLFDCNENLIEATASNIFLVKQGCLLTPDLSEAGVAGVMRGFILEALSVSQKIPVEIKKTSIRDLYLADEIFLCNSVSGIWPVVKILGSQDHALNIGPLTKIMRKALDDTLGKAKRNGAQQKE
jgi:4-amino-4-deoxychorismate lyase